MAIISCPQCGKSVSDAAQQCPHCGYHLTNMQQQQQPKANDQSSMAIFQVLSVLCYIFAVADVLCFYILDIDLTGLSFSPIIACGLGWLFSTIAGKN